MSRHIKYCLCIIAVLVACSTSLAQNELKEYLQSETPYFETIKDGMESTVCHNIVEDSDGYIWIGTQNGVSRFDGIDFQNFFCATTQERFDNDILAMCDDTLANYVWATFTTQNKIVGINKKTYRPTEINYDDQVRTDTTDTRIIAFRSIFNYNDTLLIGGTLNGLYFVNKRSGRLTGPFIMASRKKVAIYTFVESTNKTFMVSNGILYELEGRDPEFPQFKPLSVDAPGVIRHCSVRCDTSLILETYSETGHFNLVSYNPETGATSMLARTEGLPRDMACSVDGAWMCTTTGLIFYEFQTGQVRKFTTRNSYLHENKLTCILKSRHQPIVWIGSNDGLIKNDYYSSKFVITDLRRCSESNSCDMFMIHKDIDGGYWAWFVDGLFYRGAGEAEFVPIKVGDDDFARLAVTTTLEDTTRRILYFASLYSIVSYDLRTGRSEYILRQNAKRISSAVMLSDGRIAAGMSTKEMMMYDPRTHGVTYTQIADTLLTRCSTMANDGDTVLWIGDTEARLFSYNINTHRLTYHCDIGTSRSLTNALRLTCRNGERELWIATGRNGLHYYLPAKHKMTKIEYSKFLLYNVECLEIDCVDNIWAASDDGVVCINNHDGAIYEYSKDVYAVCPDFNRTASCVGHRGEVIMGGTNYFVEFNSHNFAVNDYFPAPRVAAYRFTDATRNYFDNLTKHTYFNANDTIVMVRGIRTLQLYVRVLNYDKTEGNLVQWRLTDRDDNWQTVGTIEPLVFSNLPLGVHELELRSCLANGLPTDNVHRIYIKKEVYYYEHPLFYASMIALAVIVVFAVIALRSQHAESQRRQLEEAIERQAGEIMHANDNLRRSQTLIKKQNLELQQSRDNLERQVAERTAALEEAKMKAEESSKLKSAFLANLSHEVRTPMNCIVGFAKLIGDKSCSEDERTEFIHLLQESSHSLLVLIDDLLDVSRIESGQLRVNIGDFDVCREINDVFHLLSIERKNAAVDFTLEVDARLGDMHITSDRDRFRQIIINICNNAFKFTASGHVAIKAELTDAARIVEEPAYYYPAGRMPRQTESELLLLRIDDTGIGIPEDKTEVIFEPFRKLNNKKTLYPGLGLGLNIVKNLIDLLQGEIWLHSVVGRGTTFYFYLPFSS